MNHNAHKVFVSYKYHDTNVAFLPTAKEFPTKVRDYVDVLELNLGVGNIYKGEQDGEDLSKKKEDTIWTKLKDKIYDSSVTIVCISPGMKNPNSYDYSQWIPWEVRYSLCEYAKSQRTSHTNGLIGLVLPDASGSYDYAMSSNTCCSDGCMTFNYNSIFYILEKNLFNRYTHLYGNCTIGCNVRQPEDSYMIMVRWCDFIKSTDAMNCYIKEAYQRSLHKNEYDLRLEINRSK